MAQSHKLHLINELSTISGTTYLNEEQAYRDCPPYRDMTIDDLNQEVRKAWPRLRQAGYFDVALPRTCSKEQFEAETWKHDPLNARTTAQRSKIFRGRSPEEMDESYQLAAKDYFDEIPF